MVYEITTPVSARMAAVGGGLGFPCRSAPIDR
jgi:hypothetical protein